MVPKIIVNSGLEVKELFTSLGTSENKVLFIDTEIIKNGKKKVIGIQEFRVWLGRTAEALRSKSDLVGLVWGADKLSFETQALLLKPLEELGDDSVFYLVVESEEGLMETIRSRCLLEKLNGEVALKRDFWKEVLLAWKGGAVSCLKLAGELDKEEMGEFVSSLSSGVASSLDSQVTEKRLLILREVISLSEDVKMKNLNQKMMLEDFMLRTWEIIKA